MTETKAYKAEAVAWSAVETIGDTTVPSGAEPTAATGHSV